MAAVRASLGGGIVVLAGLILASYQPQPTLIDRALPLLALSIWTLALRTETGPLREAILSLVPIVFAVEAAIPDDSVRLLLLGAAVALAAAIHLGSGRGEWRPAEILTALSVLVPLRLVVPGLESILTETTLVIGCTVLWRELRKGGASLVYAAAAVLLLTVSLPAHSFRVALIPWVVVGLVIALRRDSWIMRALIVGVAAALMKWLAAVFALVIAAAWTVGRVRRTGSPAFLPAFPATGANMTAAIAGTPFFPSLYRSPAPAAVVVVAVGLGLLVRPSLAAPIIAVGIVAACALRAEAGGRPQEQDSLLDLPALVLIGTILLFLPWSGSIVARPPAPLPLIVLLVVAALALLPASIRSWSGFAGAVLFAAFLLIQGDAPDKRRVLQRYLSAGEQLTIPVDGNYTDLELRIAGANLGDVRPGHPVADLEILDVDGRGYSRSVTLGEIADWGAFRPDHVLETQNVRPEQPAVIEGYGAGARIRGTGRVPISSAGAPRWIVVTGSSELSEDEGVIIEELRFR